MEDHGACEMIDIDVDIREVVACIKSATVKERLAEEFIDKHNGIDAVLKVSFFILTNWMKKLI